MNSLKHRSLSYLRGKLKVKVVYAKEPMPDVSNDPFFVQQYNEVVEFLERARLAAGASRTDCENK
jgi:hypothetical protein